MLRNKLTKWKSVAFRNFENKNFEAVGFKFTTNLGKYSTISSQQSINVNVNANKKKSLLTSSRVGSGSKLSIGLGKINNNQSFKLYSTKSLPPHEIILMPALSPTMTTGNIGTFHKKVGDPIEAGDVLCEIETDKAQMDFEVQEEGFLAKILIPEGTKEAQVGQPLAIFVTKKEDVAAFEDYENESAKETVSISDTKTTETKTVDIKGNDTHINTTDTQKPLSPSPTATTTTSGKVKASPLAKKIANENGIELNNLKGSGPNGRIIKNDVLSYKEEDSIVSSATTTSTGAFIDLPLTQMRKVIASRLTQSKQDIPHYYLKMDIQMDRILELRAKFNSAPLLQESFGAFKLSLNDFIVKAAALALKKVPECNSAWYDTFIRQHNKVDICVAVATPAGLITPIVNEADKKGLVAISSKVKELAAKAKINKLKPEEYQGGTFTISNLGMYGIDSFTAIINPPQSCILAVGATKLNPVTNSQVMTVTLSCDHRVVDGATGAQWLSHFKRFLEEPEQMIL